MIHLAVLFTVTFYQSIVIAYNNLLLLLEQLVIYWNTHIVFIYCEGLHSCEVQ